MHSLRPSYALSRQVLHILIAASTRRRTTRHESLRFTYDPPSTRFVVLPDIVPHTPPFYTCLLPSRVSSLRVNKLALASLSMSLRLFGVRLCINKLGYLQTCPRCHSCHITGLALVHWKQEPPRTIAKKLSGCTIALPVNMIG